MDKSTEPASLGTIRRKPDFLPKVFVSPAVDALLMPRLVNCFETILREANRKGGRSLDQLFDMFRKHGLFELKIPLQMLVNPMTFTVPDGKGKTKTVVYESAEPWSYGFEHVELPLDRARLSESTYIEESAAIYAYLFAWRLFAKTVSPEDLVMAKLDARALYEYMHSHHRGQVSTQTLSRFLIGRALQDDIDRLPVLKEFDRIGERIAARIEARLTVFIPTIEAKAAQRAAEAIEELDSMMRDALRDGEAGGDSAPRDASS